MIGKSNRTGNIGHSEKTGFIGRKSSGRTGDALSDDISARSRIGYPTTTTSTTTTSTTTTTTTTTTT